MNPIHFAATRMVRAALLALVGTLLLVGSSQAIDLQIYVNTKYGSTRVIAGSNTGGYVRRDASGQYFTDRVSKGETICAVVRATVAGETSANIWVEYTCALYSLGVTSLPGSKCFVPSSNPSCDLQSVVARSNLGLEKRVRVPIGSRPANY